MKKRLEDDGSLAHLFRRSPTKRGKSKRDWIALVLGDCEVTIHHTFNSDDPKDTPFDRVTMRKFATAPQAKRWFTAFVREHIDLGFVRTPTKEVRGWSVNPAGRRAYFTGTAFQGSKPWGKGVVVERIDMRADSGANVPPGRNAKAASAASPGLDPRRLRELARGYVIPVVTEAFVEIVERTNVWWLALLAAGLPQDVRDFDLAIRTSRPYSLAEIRVAERALGDPPRGPFQLSAPIEKKGATLPHSFVEQLRQCGDLSVRAKNLWETKTTPLRSLKDASDQLDWEIEQHGQPGTFTKSRLAARRWLRYAQIPGDSVWVMDLDGRDAHGECALYLVGDLGLPSTITKSRTVYGVKAWLISQLVVLKAAVTTAIGKL